MGSGTTREDHPESNSGNEQRSLAGKGLGLNPFFLRLATDFPLMSEAALLALLHSPSLAESPWRADYRREFAPKMSIDGEGIATVPVQGALARKPSIWELATGRVEDTDAIRNLIDQAAASSDIRGIMLAVDSPGGFFQGGPELAASVREANIRKPVVAHVAGMGASLAYLVASQASAIVASPSASVGSIGVIAMHADMTGLYEQLGIKLEVFRNTAGTLKAPGAYGTSLTDEQRTHIQSGVDAVHKIFVDTVKAARPQVKTGSMKGQTFMGNEAADLGLIDWAGNTSLAKALILRNGPRR
jgi:signal peptide peptidase SppA